MEDEIIMDFFKNQKYSRAYYLFELRCIDVPKNRQLILDNKKRAFFISCFLSFIVSSLQGNHFKIEVFKITVFRIYIFSRYLEHQFHIILHLRFT